MLVINVSNNNYEDVAYISFDEKVGLEKINHQNKNIPMIYVPVDDKNYAIAKLDATVKDIPISFVTKTMGEYTISISSKSKQYDNIYNNSFDIMGELADLTEWTNLRKRYVLGKKDYRDIVIIDNYIETIERKFSPHRSISNYYKFLSIESSIFIYSIIVISIVEMYKCLFI